jgi:hypothetical protein
MSTSFEIFSTLRSSNPTALVAPARFYRIRICFYRPASARSLSTRIGFLLLLIIIRTNQYIHTHSLSIHRLKKYRLLPSFFFLPRSPAPTGATTTAPGASAAVTEPPNYTRLSRKIIQREDNLTNLSPYNPVVREISTDFKLFHITAKIVLSLAVTIISYIKVRGIKYIGV